MNLPALKTAADWCVKHSIQIPDDIVAGLYQHGIDIKTPGYYARVMWEAVRELYAGDITQFDFEDVMIRLISEQLRKAWNEGMRELDLDPQQDQTEEGEAYLQEIMSGELDYVPQLGQDILDAGKAQSGTEEFRARVDIWVGRYEDTKNEAILFYSAKGQRLRWVYGDTEHCETCAALNGIIAFASEWDEAGVKPQSPPNDLLTCGGWRCQCSLEPTDQRRSPDALTQILDAIVSGHL